MSADMYIVQRGSLDLRLPHLSRDFDCHCWRSTRVHAIKNHGTL